jgi:hypothetical protein
MTRTNGDCNITPAILQSLPVFSESSLAARSTVGPVPSDLPKRTTRDGSTAGDNPEGWRIRCVEVPFSSSLQFSRPSVRYRYAASIH